MRASRHSERESHDLTEPGGSARVSPEREVAGARVPRSEIGDWAERFGLLAGATERGTAAPFNLGLSTREPAAEVTGRWRLLRDEFAPRFHSFHIAHQVHGKRILVHSADVSGWHIHDDADGHLTTLTGNLLSVTIADCVPVYLTRRDGSAFALLHCGWRGVAAGLLEAALAKLSNGAGSGGLVMHCGIAICGACYEVGPDVASAVTGRTVAGHQQLDLRRQLALRASAAGVGEVTVSPWCTSCHRARFFSHRGGAEGRQVAFLGRPPAV